MGLLNSAVGVVWKAGHTVAGAVRPSAGVPAIHNSDNALTEHADLPTAVREMMRGAGMVSDAGVSVTSETASRIAAVSSCIRVLSSDVAKLPLVLYRQDGKNRMPDRKNPLYRLLHDRPNAYQTSYEFRKQMMRDLLLRGIGVAQIETKFGRPGSLWRLHPDRLTIRVEAGVEPVYTYRQADGGKIDFSRDNLFILLSDTDDGFKPITPISQHRQVYGDAIALQKHGSRFFSNGAKPGGVLETDGKMDPGSKTAMREDFESLYAGTDNAHRVAVLDQQVKYKPISISMEDAQYIEARKFSRSEICGLFGVPPHKIGDLDRATFSNIEHQSLSYVNDGLMPWLVSWEQAIARDLLNDDPDRYVKFNASALLRGDAKSRAEALNIQRRAGVINANEWRALEDMNPRADDGGEVYIVEQNMTPNDGRTETPDDETR